MIVVTGAAGFIGANMVKGLNKAGFTNILAVDDLTQADKIQNLADCVVADYMDKAEFKEKTDNGLLNGKIKAIFHEGACSDTMASDGRYVMENNYRYTRDLYTFCQDSHNRAQFRIPDFPLTDKRSPSSTMKEIWPIGNFKSSDPMAAV